MLLLRSGKVFLTLFVTRNLSSGTYIVLECFYLAIQTLRLCCNSYYFEIRCMMTTLAETLATIHKFNKIIT